MKENGGQGPRYTYLEIHAVSVTPWSLRVHVVSATSLSMSQTIHEGIVGLVFGTDSMDLPRYPIYCRVDILEE